MVNKAEGRYSEITYKGSPARPGGLFILSFFVILLFGPLPVRADAGDKKQAEPTVINSQSLVTDSKAKTALFEGSVVAKRGDMTLYADRMLVHYADQKGGSNIRQIDAEGNVKLIKGERVITSAFATYFAEPEERLVFTGDPRASDGENLMSGSRMTYFIKSERSVVENSKVFLKERSQ